MKRRIVSVLMALVMVLTLLPTTAFAEGSAEEPLICSCETTCTVDNMNKECPVCGAENAIPQNCGQYIPVEDRTGENGSTERADDPNGPIELSAADQVQAMIDGLPNAEEITEDNAEEVKAQLDAIDEAKEKLSDEEIDELDMTRYAEAAAALGALAAPMLLANDSPDEQFSLAPGGRYYFDLSAMNIPGTANGDLPDSTLHYVPFTYVGTVNAYSLENEADKDTTSYEHSLFIANYNVTHTVSWDALNTAGLIFGKDYAAGGVDYTLRAPSVGSNSTGSGDSQRGVPQSNEWDRMLDKDEGHIKNWSNMYSWGQDAFSGGASYRAVRGCDSARYWISVNAAYSNPSVGFRPVLEVMNPDTLGSDGLKVVTLDLNGGKLGGSSDAIHIIVKNGSKFTAPASDGLTRPDGNTGSYFMWLGSDGKLYAPGASVPADVTKLTAQFALSEQFSLKPGGRYYFDLSAMDIPGTANGSLPDSTLHYVPFTYAGTIEAYKLTSAMATTEEYAQQNKYAHSLFVADYAVTHKVNWNNLDTASLIFGKNYASGGVDYTLRAPSVGSNSTGSGESQHDTPSNNEWDRILDKNSGYIQNWNKMYSWGQDTSSAAESFRAYRGYNSARFWYYTSSSFRNVYLGFRPVLEVLNPGTLGSDGLKVVTLDLGGGKLGNSSEDIQIIVKTGSEFTAPASDGLTRPDGDAGSFFMWLGSNGKFYAPGDSVPAEVTKLTAQWTAPTYAVTLNTNGGTIADGKDVTGYTYGVGATLPTDVTRTGYTFKGWYDNEGLTGDPVTAIGNTETGNKEYWAKWEINQYTITFDTDGGSAVVPITQDYGTDITAPAAPTKTGYTFMGWNPALPATMPAEDMTLTAQWRINQYTITFDTDGGSAVAPITQDYGTAINAPAAPTKTGYTFMGWEPEIPATMPAEDMTITAKWSINQYTVTFDTDGGSAVDAQTVAYGEKAKTPADPTKTGYTFAGWELGGNAYDFAASVTEDMTLTAKWKDSEKPTGEIKISKNSWKSFLNNITFGLFFKDTQTVTINAADNSGEAVTVEYLLSNKELTKAALDGMTFTAYTAPFSIAPDNEYIIYVRLTDKAGNTDYICSDGIVLDGTSPVIKGIENGKTYCEAQTVTINEKYVDTVTVNGAAVTLSENGGFTLAPANGGQRIVVTDKAGNTAEMTVTVNDGHTYGEWTSNGDGTHTRQCTVDGCTGSETKDCSGGTATCTEKAKCSVCGVGYGDLNPAHHAANLVNVPAKAATTSAEGNIEYWHCGGCGKYYKDAAAQDEIKQEDTVIAKRRVYYAPSLYPVRNGTNPPSGTEYSGGVYGLIFRAAVSGITGVQVDGRTIGRGSYTVEGSYPVELYLKASYLNRLAKGGHTLTVLTDSGSLTAAFTVGSGKSSPTTFDTGIAVYTAAAVTSLTGLELLRRRRKEEE